MGEKPQAEPFGLQNNPLVELLNRAKQMGARIRRGVDLRNDENEEIIVMGDNWSIVGRNGRTGIKASRESEYYLDTEKIPDSD